MKLNKLKPSTVNDSGGRTEITAGDVAVHKGTRKKKRKKHLEEREESGDQTRKTKKKIKQGKHQRLEETVETEQAEPALLGAGQWEKRERVPTPIPQHHALNLREHSHKRKKKHKKTCSLRKHEEGYSEGSETQQATEQSSEDLLIKSLPRPRQLLPLQERTDIQL